MTGDRPALLATIPDEIRARIADRRATEVGFGAGPGCIGVKREPLAPPARLEIALAWLERYRTTLRRGHVTLDDGTRLLFDPNGFVSATPARTAGSA